MRIFLFATLAILILLCGVTWMIAKRMDAKRDQRFRFAEKGYWMSHS